MASGYYCRCSVLLSTLLLATFPLLPWMFTRSAATSIVGEFACPHGFPAPEVSDPGDDVTKLHPAHVRFVASFGDSITAAVLAAPSPALSMSMMEFRQVSFSGGFGSASHHTLQWILRHYTQQGEAPAAGGATGAHDIPAFGTWGNTDFFNVALSGASSCHSNLELDQLKRSFASRVAEAEQDGWMVVTIQLGHDDVYLNSSLASCGTAEQQQGVVDSYVGNMDNLLSKLVAWRRRLYINLSQISWVTQMAELQRGHPQCQQAEIRAHEADCIHSNLLTESEKKENLAKLQSVADRMNEALVRLARKYNLIRSDVGVNLITMPTVGLDLSYFSSVDCFHPAAKSHQVMSHAVWNQMLRPLMLGKEQPSSWYSELTCADAASRLMTIRDREPAPEEPEVPAASWVKNVLV